MRKLSKRQVSLKKLSNRSDHDIDGFVINMKEQIKKDPIIIEKFKEYGVSLDDIDDVHVEFCDLDVSAKTKDKKIYLNKAMLADDNDIGDPTHYLVHEIIHYLQQKTGKNMDKHHEEEDYLDKKTEEEAFIAQVDFKKRDEGENEAEEYVDRLLDHHSVDGKERKDKKEKLLDE